MILNDELEARNNNEIVMREIDPKTLSVMFSTILFMNEQWKEMKIFLKIQ